MATVDSSVIELTAAQSEILGQLIQRYRTPGDDLVKGKEIAAAIDRNPGTIRTQMQSLKSLQLVEGVPGPKGGYRPTARAFEITDLERSEEFAIVPIEREGEPLEGCTVTEFDLINLHHPDRHEAEIYLQGSLHDLHEGDSVTLGPTPGSNLVVHGAVDGVNTAEHVCFITVEEMHFES